MLDIIRRIGEVAPPPIRLSKLFESPKQHFFSFSINAGEEMASVEVLQLLAEASVNVRFISRHFGRAGEMNVQLCVDAAHGARAMGIFQTEQIMRAVRKFHDNPGVVILSLYPFGGQPHIATRICSALRTEGIRILGIGTATSVFSCIIGIENAASAVSVLKHAFVLR